MGSGFVALWLLLSDWAGGASYFGCGMGESAWHGWDDMVTGHVSDSSGMYLVEF